MARDPRPGWSPRPSRPGVGRGHVSLGGRRPAGAASTGRAAGRPDRSASCWPRRSSPSPAGSRRSTRAATTWPRAWLDRVLPLLEPDAIVVRWWSYSTPLWYAQKVEGRRPDIFIADDRTRLDQDLGGPSDVIDANLGRRPVYVLRQNPADIDELARRYELETLTSQEAGLLVRVIGPPSGHMTRVERLSYFFPAHNEEANIEGLVAEALETLPALAETIRDHRRRRRVARRHRPTRRRARGPASGPRARRPPPDQPRLRGGPPLRLRRGALRPHRVHRRRPPVQGRRPRPPDRPLRRTGRARRRRRLPDQAGRPAHPARLCAGLPARQSDLLRPPGHRRRLRLQALPARGARGRPGRIGRRVLLGRAAHQAARGRTHGRRGRRAPLSADRRARRPGRSRRSSCGPCATSGGCACSSG